MDERESKRARNEESSSLSASEATQYDRQIRLWGLDAQKRIRSAKLLVIGATGVAIEVCKNITLAGIESLTLLDSNNVSKQDLPAQFFLNNESVGNNRAESSLAGLKRLNPNVNIVADTQKFSEKSEEFFGSFDIVCAFDLPLHQMAEINTFCRNQKTKFFCSSVCGFVGFLFLDLLDHHYVEEKTEKAKPEAKNQEDTVKTIHRKVDYVSLATSIKTSWKGVKLSRHNSKLFFFFLVVSEYHLKFDKMPREGATLAELQSIRDEALTKIGVDGSAVSDDDLGSMMSATCELGPVCAIVGGVLTNEIIKAVSGKGQPHNNFFFYNGLLTTGQVLQIGSD